MMEEKKKPINKQFRLHSGTDDELILFMEKHQLTGRHIKAAMELYMKLANELQVTDVIDIALKLSLQSTAPVIQHNQEEENKSTTQDQPPLNREAWEGQF